MISFFFETNKEIYNNKQKTTRRYNTSVEAEQSYGELTNPKLFFLKILGWFGWIILYFITFLLQYLKVILSKFLQSYLLNETAYHGGQYISLLMACTTWITPLSTFMFRIFLLLSNLIRAPMTILLPRGHVCHE